MDRSRRNVLLLALCQAAFLSISSMMKTIGSLAGHDLASDKALATLPATALTVGTALGTIPASLLMRRVGRRLGFIVGSGLTIAGGLVGAWAVVIRSFGLPHVRWRLHPSDQHLHTRRADEGPGGQRLPDLDRRSR